MPIVTPSAPPRKNKPNAAANSQAVTIVNEAPLSAQARDWAEGLEGWFDIGQVVCLAKGWHADVGAIAMHKASMSQEIARVGENVESVGKVLDYLRMTGPYAALMTAALPFVIQIAMNHHILPPTIAMEGTMHPKALEAQVKSQVAVNQLQAIRAQKEAEAALAEAEAELKMVNAQGGSR